jgi:hypothetical protein
MLVASEKIVNIAHRASSSDASIAWQIEGYEEMVWSRGKLPLPISPVNFIFLSNIFEMLVTCFRLKAACLSLRVISELSALFRIHPPGSRRVKLRFIEHDPCRYACSYYWHLQMLLERTCFCMMRLEPISFSELVSGCRKIFSSVNRGRLRDVSREIIAVVFAPYCLLRQAFHLDLLIAACIACGAAFLFH